MENEQQFIEIRNTSEGFFWSVRINSLNFTKIENIIKKLINYVKDLEDDKIMNDFKNST